MATSISHLATEGFWCQADNIDSFVAAKLCSGGTALVLGAGASHGFNLPDWSSLVSGLRGSRPAPMPPVSLERQADELFINQFSRDRMAFARAVRGKLYEAARAHPDFLLKSELLQAVAAFVTSSLRGKGGSVINFNFDDILETYLKLLGFIVRSVTVVPAWASKSDVVVYHPHGLLPMKDDRAITNIVFTSSDFDEVVGRPSEWNISMSAVMTTTFPIFIGLSGNDARLRSLLLEVRDRHPATQIDGSKYWGVRPTPASADQYEIEKWREWGIVPRIMNSYSDIPAWLLSICQRAAGATEG